MYIHKKTALILGASKGIGLACAKAFVKEGIRVVAISRTPGGLPNLENVVHYPCDLSNHKKLKNTIEKIRAKENISIIVNNAGGPPTGDALSSETSKFETAFKTHLLAYQIAVQSFTPAMKSNKFGKIINIISVTAKVPIKNLCVSNALRGAVLNWSKTLSIELAPFNINVNNVLPGYTKTERLKEVIASCSEEKGTSPESFSKLLIDEIPMGRFGRPEEIASTVYFLASNNSSFINGASIPVDGGWMPCA